MNKTLKLYGIIFFVVMLILGILMVNKKEVVNWSKNFDIEKKSPFGLFIFHQESDNFFQNRLEKVEKTPYLYYEKEQEPHNILFVEEYTDRESWKKILNQVSKGSDLMYFTGGSYGFLTDTLNINPHHIYNTEEVNTLTFTDTKRTSQIFIDKMPSLKGFRRIPKNAEVLGLMKTSDSTTQANFIKIPFGKGNVYWHTEPLCLTNYYLLKDNNYQYVEDVLSYLPNRKTVWFVKEIDIQDLARSGHPLGFVLEHPALKYAWWILLTGLFILIFFRAKRTQRIIPIITPKKNKSVEFVKSIGNLYLQEGDIRDMMKKKTQYFLHHLRTDLFLDTQKLDEKFIKKLHLKTGAKEEKIETLIKLIQQSENAESILGAEDLLKLNTIIDEILKQ